jgi:hypothetical protein
MIFLLSLIFTLNPIWLTIPFRNEIWLNSDNKMNIK